jgi:hypothetical protein
MPDLAVQHCSMQLHAGVFVTPKILHIFELHVKVHISKVLLCFSRAISPLLLMVENL